MANKPWPKEKFTSGIATLAYPHLHAKDTRFDEPEDAKFKTKFNLSAEDAQPLVKMAKNLIASAKKQGLAKADPKAPYTKEDDGTYTFEAKSKHRPALFDAKRIRLADGLKVGGGTRARLAGTMQAYEGFGNTGVTLYLNAVQIIDLKQFGDDAASFGFDAMEGFTGDDLDEADDPFSEDEGDLDGGDDPLDGDSTFDEEDVDF